MSNSLSIYIKHQFNQIGNVLNGSYWKIQQQRENLVKHYTYDFLIQKALKEGNQPAADIYIKKLEKECFEPCMDDPTYSGSHREKQDLFDALFQAKKAAEKNAKIMEHHGVPIPASHKSWMKKDLEDFLEYLAPDLNKPELHY